MIIAGYIGIVFMGIVLGLMGGGGAILTVPILTYLFSVDALMATNYSLFVVGASSCLGAYQQWRMGNVRWDMVLKFGLPSIVGVILMKKILVPLVPSHISNFGSFELTKGKFTIILFAILMILSSYSMIKKKKNNTTETQDVSTLRFTLQGFIVGCVTGMLGAGGGFLIIPALVFIARLSMKEAVASSLAIISVNALLGFLSVSFQIQIDWILLIQITSVASMGMLIGSMLSKKISNEKLKPAFGWFVLTMGIFIIFKELF